MRASQSARALECARRHHDRSEDGDRDATSFEVAESTQRSVYSVACIASGHLSVDIVIYLSRCRCLSLHLPTDCLGQSHKPFWPCNGSNLPLTTSTQSESAIVARPAALTVRNCIDVELHPIMRMAAPSSFVQVLRCANAWTCGVILRRSDDSSIHNGSRLQVIELPCHPFCIN